MFQRRFCPVLLATRLTQHNDDGLACVCGVDIALPDAGVGVAVVTLVQGCFCLVLHVVDELHRNDKIGVPRCEVVSLVNKPPLHSIFPQT